MNMGEICKEWVPTPENPRRSVSLLPKHRPIMLTLKVEGAAVDPNAIPRNILIAQGVANNEELWALRMLPDGRLTLYAGTADPVSILNDYPDWEAKINYNPEAGGIGVCLAELTIEKQGEVLRWNRRTLAGNCKSSWAEQRGWIAWDLRLGANESLADLSPFGWKITASYRLEDPIPEQAEVIRRDGAQAADTSIHGRPFCYGGGEKLGGPTTKQVETIEQDLQNAIFLVPPTPQETLKLAVESIAYWSGIAKDAYEKLEVKP